MKKLFIGLVFVMVCCVALTFTNSVSASSIALNVTDITNADTAETIFLIFMSFSPLKVRKSIFFCKIRLCHNIILPFFLFQSIGKLKFIVSLLGNRTKGTE